MSRLLGKTVFITGASAGIGASCARKFAAEGSNVILIARRLERLEKLRKQLTETHPLANVHIAQLDVRDRKAVTEVVNGLPPPFREIHVLVNNAGMVTGVDPVDSVSPDNVDLMFDTNVKGLLHVTQAILPSMKERNEGHVINIGSIAGKEAYAGGGIYCATKHAVDAITRSLRAETLASNIRISEINPGLVETEFSMVRFDGDEARAKKVYEGMNPLTGDDIAEIIVFTASRPPHVNIADTIVLATAQNSAQVVARKTS